VPEYEGIELAYYNSLKIALEDGSLDQKEFKHLKELREQLSISMETHSQMESKLREETTLRPNSAESSLGIKDSVISKSKITNIAGDSVTNQYSSGDVDNYAKMMVDFISRGKIGEAIEIWQKAQEVNFERTKEIFQGKYSPEIESAYFNHIQNVSLPNMQVYLKQYNDATLKVTAQSIYPNLVEAMRRNTSCCENAIEVIPESARLHKIYAQSLYEYNKVPSDQIKSDTFDSDMGKAKEQIYRALKVEPNNTEIIALSKKIENEKKPGGCFITTATVNYMGEADNGQTLTALRNFRDTFMSKTKSRKKQLDWYYAHAPEIVKSLDSLENKEEVYTKLYKSYILPAANAHKCQQKSDAFNLYKAGIKFSLKNISPK
jgi:hypothetical protein